MQFFFSVLQNVQPLVSDDSMDTPVNTKAEPVILSKKENGDSKK